MPPTFPAARVVSAGFGRFWTIATGAGRHLGYMARKIVPLYSEYAL